MGKHSITVVDTPRSEVENATLKYAAGVQFDGKPRTATSHAIANYIYFCRCEVCNVRNGVLRRMRRKARKAGELG